MSILSRCIEQKIDQTVKNKNEKMGRAVPIKWSEGSHIESGPNRPCRGVPGRNYFWSKLPGTKQNSHDYYVNSSRFV